MTQILVCEDSMEGIFTAVYEAYARKCIPNDTYIQIGEEENFRLFSEYIRITTNPEKAEKVANTLKRQFGEKDFEDICYITSSFDKEKGQAVYQTIVSGLMGRKRYRLLDDLTNPYVQKAMELRRNVWCEVHHYLGFLRFEEMENGILFAKVSPKNNVLMFLAAHFGDRLPGENFVIDDTGRKLYALHPKGQEWFLVSGEFENELDLSIDEKKYQDLFRYFCDRIAIKERKNLELQRNLLPLRFREHMIEFP